MLLLAAASLVVAACGGDNGPDGETATPSSDPVVAEPAPDPPAAAASNEADATSKVPEPTESAGAADLVSITHAVGVQTLDPSEGPTIVRDVEVWQADDGRFRVATRTRGALDAEEFAYDGADRTLAVATDQGGQQDALVRRGEPRHFALTGIEGGTTVREDGIIVRTEISGNGASILYEVTSTEQVLLPGSVLEIDLPDGVSIPAG